MRLALLVTLLAAAPLAAQHAHPDSAAAAAAAARADSAPPVTALRWTGAPAVPVGRDHHVTFLTRGRGRDLLWVVGGNDYRNILGDVWRASVARDGTVGAWEAADSLPSPHGGLAVAQTDRWLVLTGGQTTRLQRTADVFVARIQNDGTLGAFTPGPKLFSPRYHHSSVVHRGWVYVTGGIEQSVSMPNVWRARLADDGSLGAWEPLPDLPRARSHHAALVHDGALWLVAGQDGNPAGRTEPLADVIRARFQPDGTLGAWETVTTLPHAYATHAAFIQDDHLWLLGGVEDNARFVDVVWRARLERGGRVGAWQRVAAPLPAPRAHVHQTPVLRGRVYSVGGSNRRVVTGEVVVGEIVK